MREILKELKALHINICCVPPPLSVSHTLRVHKDSPIKSKMCTVTFSLGQVCRGWEEGEGFTPFLKILNIFRGLSSLLKNLSLLYLKQISITFLYLTHNPNIENYYVLLNMCIMQSWAMHYLMVALKAFALVGGTIFYY